jgi:hypothetical protein
MPVPMSALAGSFKNALRASVTTVHFEPPITISDIDPDSSRTKYMSSGNRSPWRISPVQAASGSRTAPSRLASGTLMMPVPVLVVPPVPVPLPLVLPTLAPACPAPPAPVGLSRRGLVLLSPAEHPAAHVASTAATAAPHAPALTLNEALRIANLPDVEALVDHY